MHKTETEIREAIADRFFDTSCDLKPVGDSAVEPRGAELAAEVLCDLGFFESDDDDVDGVQTVLFGRITPDSVMEWCLLRCPEDRFRPFEDVEFVEVPYATDTFLEYAPFVDA